MEKLIVTSHACRLLSTTRPTVPLRMALMGKAGTGKSHVLEALLWHAFQHDLSDRVVVLSYTWRAALHISTPSNMGCSTSSFFGINLADDLAEKPAAITRLKDRLHPDVRLILIDENSFNNCRHFFSMSRACELASSDWQGTSTPDETAAAAGFGHLDIVCTGDFKQHPPINSEALYSDLLSVTAMAKASPAQQHAQAGRKIWREFKQVFFLTKQYRFEDSEDGRKLTGMLDELTDKNLTKRQVRVQKITLPLNSLL